jgi:hypothetical protein
MAYKQPDAGKDAFLFLLVDGVVDKNFAADHTFIEIDQMLHRVGLGRHSYAPPACPARALP